MQTIQNLGKKAKGAKPGNTIGKDTSAIKAALHYVLVNHGEGKDKGQALKRIAKKAVEDAIAGDKAAREWISERYEGKVAQVIAGDQENPIQSRLTIEFVN